MQYILKAHRKNSDKHFEADAFAAWSKVHSETIAQ